MQTIFYGKYHGKLKTIAIFLINNSTQPCLVLPWPSSLHPSQNGQLPLGVATSLSPSPGFHSSNAAGTGAMESVVHNIQLLLRHSQSASLCWLTMEHRHLGSTSLTGSFVITICQVWLVPPWPLYSSSSHQAQSGPANIQTAYCRICMPSNFIRRKSSYKYCCCSLWVRCFSDNYLSCFVNIN